MHFIQIPIYGHTHIHAAKEFCNLNSGARGFYAPVGFVNSFLMALGIIEKPLKLMNTHGAVLLGMTYGLLPFMILPTYASAEKMDRSLVDAGRDLGAKPWKVFWTVELPQTLPGLMAGCVLFIVPMLIVYMIVQRWFIESIDRVGITG